MATDRLSERERADSLEFGREIGRFSEAASKAYSDLQYALGEISFNAGRLSSMAPELQAHRTRLMADKRKARLNEIGIGDVLVSADKLALATEKTL